jgi:hypothetical protein
MQKTKMGADAARAAKRAVKSATKSTVGAVETRILAAEGKRSLKAKAHTVGKVAKKAVKTGLIVGAVAAGLVVRHEVKKRRKLAK